MIEIGKVNTFIVERTNSSGFYLKDAHSDDEVFMPPSLGPLNMKVGDEIKAFVYHDKKLSRIATSQIPYAQVGEYALLDVVETQEFGAFFDWGIDKDLIVPGNEQKVKVRPHEDHLVRVCLEEETQRVYGTTKVGKYIKNSDFDVAVGDSVDLVPFQKTDLGHRVIINKKFIGMIYANETFVKVKIGEVYGGVVKKLRDDGLIDAALQVQGVQNLFNSKELIMDFLKKNNGQSNLNDKSSPQEIRDKLGVSKKTFKNSIGMLFKEKKIFISSKGIKLV